MSSVFLKLSYCLLRVLIAFKNARIHHLKQCQVICDLNFLGRWAGGGGAVHPAAAARPWGVAAACTFSLDCPLFVGLTSGQVRLASEVVFASVGSLGFWEPRATAHVKFWVVLATLGGCVSPCPLPGVVVQLERGLWECPAGDRDVAGVGSGQDWPQATEAGTCWVDGWLSTSWEELGKWGHHSVGQDNDRCICMPRPQGSQGAISWLSAHCGWGRVGPMGSHQLCRGQRLIGYLVWKCICLLLFIWSLR